MKITDPSLTLTFTADDLEPGHATTQMLGKSDLVFGSFQFKDQRMSGLKSSSDQVSLQLRRRCGSVEDIISTEGNIEAVLKDGDTVLFTGYVSTSFSWGVTDHGEEALRITLEGVGTRLLNKPFIETGKHYLSASASAVVYMIVNPLGISIRSGDDRKLLQTVSHEVDAGTTCRELLDQLFYECNAVYWFNNLGELCIEKINPNTEDAPLFNHSNLLVVDGKAVKVTKQLRSYRGARVSYNELAEADDYLIYRNTTNQSEDHPYCDLPLQGGEYFDGNEIYTDAEWSEATADEFREPALIGAVNADSESSIVGSERIENISGLVQVVEKDAAITFSAEIAGGPYFKLLAHNTSASEAHITRMDLRAHIVYVKSHGIIRTQIDGPTDGKSLLEESLSWIHDKGNASRHANLLAQYHKSAASSYTFYSRERIAPGTVIRLNDDVFSGLDVYVLVIARQYTDKNGAYTYNAVGVTTFDLTQDAYHGTTEQGHQSGTQGPQGAPGETAEIQYALGTSIVDPPSEAMQWGGADMLWDGETMIWNDGLYTDDVPDLERGKYIWMRTRVGDGPWQYTRLTGTTSWDAENLGICTTATPTTSSQGLGIIPGDYFVAGAQFTENGKTYYSGYAYYYTGVAWSEMNLETEEAAVKAQSLMDKLVSANMQIPESSSSYSVWKWAKNFVSQNAVINNLFSQAITVLSGGYIKGGDRYNSSGQISDWTKKGFWFGADGTLMASLQSDGNGNTYVGTSVGANSNSPGSYNTAVGYAAMFKTTSGGDYNIALGYTALHENQTGDNNIAIGYQALYYNTASDNIGIGTNALVYNTSGTYNVGIGYNSLYSNTTGNYNVAIGYEALKINSASNNIAIGYHSLATNGAGDGNVGIGVRALVGNSSGNYNVALGNASLSNNYVGSNNISIGQLSMEANGSGCSNIGIGHAALRFNTSGGGNIAIGYDASCYSPTGYRQMNINNALICLEFKANRTYSQVYTALKSYFANTTDKAGCIGFVDGDYVTRIEVIDSSTIRVYGGSYHNFTNSSSTLTKRMVLFFVNPKLISDTSNDCLT